MKKIDIELANKLLHEAFDALRPYRDGGSDEAQRQADLRARIAGYLATHGSLTLPPAGGGGGPATFGDSAMGVIVTRGGGGGTWNCMAVYPAGPTFVAVGNDSYTAIALQRAKEYGVPVCFAGGGGGGGDGFKEWAFPDGHTEHLPFDETPTWPKANSTRDAVDANR